MEKQRVLRPVSFVRDLALLAALAIAFLLPACSIQHTEKGDNKDVKIETPFGGMQVKADDKKPADTGLAQYPNARVKEKKGDNDNNANVDMSFGPFGMKVAAVTYLTDDPKDKVLEFYRKDLARYGKVLECKGDIDDEGDDLVCKPGKHETEIELGTGTKMRRHIVAVKTNGSGTEFSLVYLQLRGGKEGEL